MKLCVLCILGIPSGRRKSNIYPSAAWSRRLRVDSLTDRSDLLRQVIEIAGAVNQADAVEQADAAEQVGAVADVDALRLHELQE